jgi:DNA repair ATPase RecN
VPSHTVHAIEGLKSSLKALQAKADRVQSVRDQVVDDLRAKREEVSTLASRQEILTKVLELYRLLMDKMVSGQVKVIESLVSEGLKSIFWDQDLSFGLELGQKANKISAEPYLQNGLIVGDPLDSFGGGPASVVSLILRVMVLLRLKRNKMLFLDESLAAVSDEYIEMTGQFLRKLSESSNLPIFLVTHKQAYLEHATCGYHGSKSDEEEFLVRKIRGGA